MEKSYLIPNAPIAKLRFNDYTSKRYSYHNAYWGYWDEHEEDRSRLAKLCFDTCKSYWLDYMEITRKIRCQSDIHKVNIFGLTKNTMPYNYYDMSMSSIAKFKEIDDVDFIIKYGAIKFKVAYWFSLLGEGQSMKDMLTKRFANYANDRLCLRCKKREAAYIHIGLCYKCKCWVKSFFANDEEYRGITRPYPIRSITEWRQLVNKETELLQWG